MLLLFSSVLTVVELTDDEALRIIGGTLLIDARCEVATLLEVQDVPGLAFVGEVHDMHGLALLELLAPVGRHL